MARKTDPEKIERVRKAAMEMIVEYGTRAYSIASIAKRAGVSTGYLYRYYESKDALMSDLIDTNMAGFEAVVNKSIEENRTLAQIIYSFTKRLVEAARTDTLLVKFLISIVFESALCEVPDEKREKHEYFIRTMRESGIRNNEISQNATDEDIVSVFFSIPFMYVSEIMKKENSQELLNDDLARKITRMCINALV